MFMCSIDQAVYIGFWTFPAHPVAFRRVVSPVVVRQYIPWQPCAGLACFVPSDPSPVWPPYDPNIFVDPFVCWKFVGPLREYERVNQLITLPAQFELV